MQNIKMLALLTGALEMENNARIQRQLGEGTYVKSQIPKTKKVKAARKKNKAARKQRKR